MDIAWRSFGLTAACCLCLVATWLGIEAPPSIAVVYGGAPSGLLLAYQPLVVPGVDLLDGGQQASDQAVAERVNPQAVFAREVSRTAYSPLSATRVGRLLSKTFPAAIDRPAGGASGVPAGAHVLGYPSAHAIDISLPGHMRGIVESSAPVAKRGVHGRFTPINLAIAPVAGGYAPTNSTLAVRIPKQISAGVSIPANGVTLTPVGSNGRPLDGTGSMVHTSVVYANTQAATDTVVKPTATGFQIDAVLRSSASPQRLYYRVGAPAGSKLVLDRRSGVVGVVRGGATLAKIMPPGAVDAAETPVPASMSVVGRTVVVSVAHRAGSYLYPIDVDPEVNDSQLAETTGKKRSNWEFKSTNEARFGHKMVYEGVGKERLETTGTAQYVSSELGYWGYETKGNSKIYELKTKTSAKNKGAKVESFLEFQAGTTHENKKMLSNETEEPEYTEKSSTICAWNASKVEECLPGAGKEKNVVRFQQSATTPPGSTYAFSDTMSEGVVSISEPSGEHSTTGFNTTSPEVEGVVEGKTQKRVNALYGSGIWLTNSKGALQMIAKDPGIGVSATHLEYEKAAGSWERLSEHNYLEVENACQGVQCYAEHTEYWTLDPKLPDGEDKIRYRAQEVIAGTESPAAEETSTKTIKVDTKAPHDVAVNGLPYGNELSEKPYTLVAEASDGEGSTVASSGIKSITMSVAGEVKTPSKEQLGCKVAKGECRATAEWTINGAELGAGHHAIVVLATDNAGNEARIEETISIRHSTPVAMGPGSVDLQSGDFALGQTDVSMGSGLTVARNYSSRATGAGDEGPLGPEWSFNLGTTESLVEMPDHSMLLTDAKGEQSIFAALGGGEFEPPTGDANLKLTLEENKTTKQKLAYYLEDVASHTKTKFTLPSGGSKVWAPSKQEGTVSTDTVTYTYRAAEQNNVYHVTHPETQVGSVVAGPDGNMWFTASSYLSTPTSEIGKVTPTGEVTEYPLSGASHPYAISVGPDGNLWFTNYESNDVGKITTRGVITEYALASGSHPMGIAAGSDGKLWFTEFGAKKIASITTSGTIATYALPTGSGPIDITSGPDGNLWFTDYSASKIGKITTAGIITEYELASGSQPDGIAAGPDGRLWFANSGTDKIGAVTTAGAVKEYSTSGCPQAVTQGPDKTLWFTSGCGVGKVGKITVTGAVSEYAEYSSGNAAGLAFGTDGNAWFPKGTNYVGFMTPSGTITEPIEALAPIPSGVSCSPMKTGCRALKFSYATTITATGEARGEWGEFTGRLAKVLLDAYDPVAKEMKETTVAQYSYDVGGRLRAEWDPRVSPTLKTTYGYDAEGHVTALSPSGQEPWVFSYGVGTNDSGRGRLVKMERPATSEALWGGEVVKNTGAPGISGSPVTGVRMTVSNGSWTGTPIAYSYQWEDCNATGESCTPIAKANAANYVPVASDVGHTLLAVVIATNGGGSVARVAATATSEVKSRIVEYGLPTEDYPEGISTEQKSQYLWFADGTHKIGTLELTSEEFHSYSLPSESYPTGIASGPDSNLWFADSQTSKIGKITASGAVTEYALPSGSSPTGIVSMGGNLWFTDYGTSKIGKITTAGVITEYALPAKSNPMGIAALGEDLWFTDNSTSKVGKINSTTGVITEYALPEHSSPWGIVLGNDVKMWFTEAGTDKIGNIAPGAGTIVEYSLPSGSRPESITNGPDQRLWFGETGTASIGASTISGVISELHLSNRGAPAGIVTGPDKNVWFADREPNSIGKIIPTVTEGAVKTPTPGWTVDYGVPLSGGSGLQAMTSSEAAKWGQTDSPTEATAIVPPDAKQGWPASSYSRATVYYLDAHGRQVNVSGPSTATYGSVSTTEYNEMNDVARTLSPDNRQVALEAGSKSAEVAKSLSTYMSYREECSKESENRHETESLAEGARLCDVEGPQHTIKYKGGSEQKESLGRLHTKYFYDEEAPGGETYNLQTTTVTLAELSNEAKEEVEGRVMKTSYSGQSNLGWKLRAPTSVTVDPEGKKLTTTTLYNSSTGQITETRSPAGSGGGSPHDTKYVYYTAEANTEGYSTCGAHPEWAGLLCETLPAKQPETIGVPNLPVITTTYNMYDEPLVVTEAFGSTVRTKTKTYDEAGRLATSETASTANTALPKLTDEYSSKTGVLEKLSTTVGGKTTTLTSVYNTLGEMTEYTDADGNITKYRYAGPENDGLLEEVADGSNSGTGKQAYSYNSTTKQLEELTDSAAGVFKASYDAEGRMTSEVYPNAVCADSTYNSVGEATKIEYLKTATCTEHGAPVWFSEARAPSVRGETLSREGTLANESYSYDSVGRLIEAQETLSGEGCSVRLYAYDEESNRTSQTTRTPGTGGKCATEGGAVLNHTYDAGNRLTDTAVAYDSFGNVTKVPAADAEGHELSSSFYVSGAVASQTQNGVTNNYYLDPEGRIRETVDGANATISHYDGSGDTVVWTSETGGKSTRNIPGIDGSLAAIQTNGGTPVLQLHDLQGDIAATAALSPSETKVLSTYNSTEFGVPNKEKAPPKFAWLGAGGVASSLSSGVITYGATSYVPQIGRALQSEVVEAPGIAPGGTGAGAAYVSQEEPWVFQGAAAEAAEAPGLEAAREQAALEAAWAAATDPVEIHYMNKTKARALAEKLWEAKSAGELAGALAVPADWVDAAVGLVAGLGLDDVYNWFDETAEMMSKCGNNKWNVVGVKPDICKVQYDVIHALGSTFVDFTTSAKVWVCFDNSGGTCFHEVYADKKEKSCALGGLICIA